MSQYIPLSTPILNGNEMLYVKECIDTEWVSSAGKYVNLFEEKIAEYAGVKHAIACVNGTSALQVSLRLSGVLPGDEVIAPTLTFIAPINAIAYNGASPVFMDADRYYNIDIEKTISFIEDKTIFKEGFTYNKITNKRISAIVPVDVWGNACEIDMIADLCKERNIEIVVDGSESLGTFYNKSKNKGKQASSVGIIRCLSFNGNKIITTGGGGMILTNHSKVAEKAKYLTTQAKDDAIRYVHDEIGYNFRLTNIQAALGVAQLEQLPGFLESKRDIYNHYKKALGRVEGLSLSSVPDYAQNNHWLNLLQIENDIYGENKEEAMKRLEENRIQVRPVWKLNHNQKPYIDCQHYKIENALKLFDNSLCLPSSSNLSLNDLNYIINCLSKV